MIFYILKFITFECYWPWEVVLNRSALKGKILIIKSTVYYSIFFTVGYLSFVKLYHAQDKFGILTFEIKLIKVIQLRIINYFDILCDFINIVMCIKTIRASLQPLCWLSDILKTDFAYTYLYSQPFQLLIIIKLIF